MCKTAAAPVPKTWVPLDYRVEGGVLVERKTVADLHGSLARGRLWSQVGRVRDVAVSPFLFVEGDDLDAGPRHPNAIRGCLLAVADLGVAVVRTRDPDDTSLWLHRLAIGQERRRSSSRREQRRLRPPPGVTALAGIPGISDTTARALLERFGTVERLLAARSTIRATLMRWPAHCMFASTTPRPPRSTWSAPAA